MFEEEPIRSTRPMPLDQMSIEQLQARIEEVREEIALCEQEIEKKRAQKAAADALFGGS